MARVLVVEDQQENLDLMVYLLRAFGHEVVTAGNGADGLEAAGRERPDLMVIDIQMPMNGLELVAALKADPYLARIPTIGVTALSMVGDRDRILSAGFDGYLSKPIDPDEFVSELEVFLDPQPHEPEPDRAAILMVDEGPEDLGRLEHVLRQCGHIVTTAFGGPASLVQAHVMRPDLIVIDLRMSHCEGWELARQIRRDPLLGTTPLLALSVGPSPTESMGEGGFDGFVTLPFEPDDLVGTVHTILLQDNGRKANEAGRGLRP